MPNTRRERTHFAAVHVGGVVVDGDDDGEMDSAILLLRTPYRSDPRRNGGWSGVALYGGCPCALSPSSRQGPSNSSLSFGGDDEGADDGAR